jgi:hypothetical protein
MLHLSYGHKWNFTYTYSVKSYYSLKAKNALVKYVCCVDILSTAFAVFLFCCWTCLRFGGMYEYSVVNVEFQTFAVVHYIKNIFFTGDYPASG